MSAPVLEVRNLIKNYDTYRAVDDISFEIKKGQVLGLLGPNGAGKSTTIQILVGITTPTTGSIRYFGLDFTKYKQACLQRINFASAYNTLQGRITVKENLRFFAGLYQVDDPINKIAELLEYFEISPLARHKFWDLSAGERTRVNLVKSLLNDPELILMDEPTASLDPDIADKTLSLIEQLREDRGISILFTSHNMSEVTRVCDEVIFLDRGSIVNRGSPAELVRSVRDVQISLQYTGSQKQLETLLAEHGFTVDQIDKQTVVFRSSNDRVGEAISMIIGAGLQINDTEIQKPTLDDVFLDIARREKS